MAMEDWIHLVYLWVMARKLYLRMLLQNSLLCGFLFLASISHSTDNGFPFTRIEHFTTENGLSNNNVYNLMEDKKGFIWIATAYGLNRYDGYTFKEYTYDIQDKNSLTAGWCSSLLEDREGIIWFISSTEGFYSFNPQTERFFHYRHEPGNSNSVSNDVINNTSYNEKEGILWMATAGGLDAFDTRTKKFRHFVHQPDDSTSISSNKISSSIMDEKGNLILGYESFAVDYFNTRSGKVTSHFNFHNSSGQPLHIRGFNKGTNGNIWMGVTGGGFICYSLIKKSYRYFPDKPYAGFPSTDGHELILEDRDGNLWMDSDLPGLGYYDISKQRFHHLTYIKELAADINVVFGILADRSGKIWIATEQTGLFAVDTKYKRYFSFRHEKETNSVADNLVNTFLEDKQRNFYICSKGVDLFDTTTKKFSNLKITYKSKDFLKDNPVWSCYEDSKEVVWFCTGYGLASYNPKTQASRIYVHDKNDTTSLGSGSCTGITEDSKGRYWVTSWPDGGLQSFDPGTGIFGSFNKDRNNKPISTRTLGGFMPDLQGNFYVASWNGGMIIFNPDSGIFNIFNHDADDASSVSCDIVFDVEESKSGIVWVCTLGGGLNAFDPRTGKFRSFTMQDGLPSNAIQSIVEDNNKNYWLGTLAGISCFSPPENPFDPNCNKIHFRNYNVSDGLPANDMTLRAAFKTGDGKIYFGTQSKGFFYFNPDELKDNEYIPPVFITDFKLFNRSVTIHDSSFILTVPIEDTKQIKLSYDKNVISFTFAALSFIHPEKNQYAYMLQGFDKDWIYTDANNRVVNYTNLDAGEYFFKVKASNNDGLWNEAGASLQLIILPPFWQTWWFRISIVAALVAAMYLAYRYRLQQVMKLQVIRNNIASDLHDDIGSTLNSISIYSEVAKQEAGTPIPSLDLIGVSARKIVESMSDIVWTINPENDSFEKVIARMRSFSYQLMKAKKIEFLFDADTNLNKLSLDMQVRKNFYLIFKEAVNNLAKYSNATRVSISISGENGQIRLTVRDNGKGFNSTQSFDGNGMLNMKRRAGEIGGQLNIESSVGTGTSVELNLKA